MFAKAYPGEPLTQQTAAKALAAFERTVVSTGSRFDQWAAGDRRAITQQEWRGYQLFKGKANCAACHSGPNFTDNGFHNVGLKTNDQVFAWWKPRDAVASVPFAGRACVGEEHVPGVSTHGSEHLHVGCRNAVGLRDSSGDAGLAVERQLDLWHVRAGPERHLSAGVEL
jgi:cytochrome c peroxidase